MEAGAGTIMGRKTLAVQSWEFHEADFILKIIYALYTYTCIYVYVFY